MRERIVLLICAAGAILLGLPYVQHLFGPTEAEVAHWGLVTIGIGIILGLLWLTLRASDDAWTRYVIVFVLMVLGVLQVPPAALWVAFQGNGISDGSPPSSFVANWALSLPHLALLCACCAGIALLLRRRPDDATAGISESE